MKRAAFLLSALLSLPNATFVAAQTGPTAELSRLVPDSFGFGLVIHDLRGCVDRVADSPLFQALERSPIAARLRKHPEVANLKELERQLQRTLGVGFQQLRDDVFGDAVIFAARSAEGDGEDDTLLLLISRKPELLTDLFARLQREQMRTGEVREMRERRYRERTYFRRVKNDGTEEYLTLRGGVFVLASKEATLTAVIDAELDRPTIAKVEPKLIERRRRLQISDTILSFHIDPRSMDAALRKSASTDDEAQHAFSNGLMSYWRAIDDIAIYIRIQSELEIGAAFRCRWEEMPPSGRKFFGEFARPIRLAHCIPDDALFAFQGRFHPAAFADLAADFVPPKIIESIRLNLKENLGPAVGKDRLADLLHGIGPEFGLWLTTPQSPMQPYPHAILALETRSPKNGATDIGKILLGGLDFLSGLARFQYNSRNTDQIEFEQVLQDTTVIRVLSGEKCFPRGIQPAYAVRGGYLLLADSPESITQFPNRLPDSKSEKNPIIRISFAAWRRYLKSNGSALVGELIAKYGAEQSVKEDIASALEVLEWFELLEVRAEERAECCRLTVRLRFRFPAAE